MKKKLSLTLLFIFLFTGCSNKQAALRINTNGDGAAFMQGDVYKF